MHACVDLLMPDRRTISAEDGVWHKFIFSYAGFGSGLGWVFDLYKPAGETLKMV
jgi:hypothetical protein